MDVILMIAGGLAFGLLGVSFGYQAAMAKERKSGGGRTASELRTELDDYQQNVSDHFMESAALLQGMTEQYKKIYEHMARGAQELCETKDDRPELAALRNGLLAAALAASTHEDLLQVGKVLEAQASSVSDGEDGDAPTSVLEAGTPKVDVHGDAHGPEPSFAAETIDEEVPEPESVSNAEAPDTEFAALFHDNASDESVSTSNEGDELAQIALADAKTTDGTPIEHEQGWAERFRAAQ